MKRITLIVAITVLALVGCRAPHQTEVSSGDPLLPNEQQSLYEERLGQNEEPDAAVRGTVYWTPSGTKYHKDPNCSYLKNAKEVHAGTAAQAANHGASEPCSRCAGG